MGYILHCSMSFLCCFLGRFLPKLGGASAPPFFYPALYQSENADWYARGVGGAAAREIKDLYQPAFPFACSGGPIESFRVSASLKG